VRDRVDFGGIRAINSVLSIASITQGRFNPAAQAQLARRITVGETVREALR